MYLKLKSICETGNILDYGVSVNKLIDCNWPLIGNCEEMKTRLQLCKDELISPIKPWMLITNQEYIDK